MNNERLKQIERRAAALTNGASFVTVTFTSGQRRTMRMVDVIDHMKDGGDELRIVDVEGDVGGGNGQLVELLRGLLEPVEDHQP